MKWMAGVSRGEEMKEKKGEQRMEREAKGEGKGIAKCRTLRVRSEKMRESKQTK